MSVRKILIPIDFSLSSHLAAQAGAKLASRLGIEARLVHVIEPVPALNTSEGQLDSFAAEVSMRASQAMAKTLADLSTQGGELSSSIRHGEVGPELLRAADEPPASLIVIGSSGRSDDEPFLLGSVAARLIRDAKCPVLVLRGAHARHLPEEGLFKRPLVTVDYSRFSEVAIRYAAALSEPDAALELYHALFVPRFELFPEGEIDKYFSGVFEFNRKKQDQRLRSLASEAGVDRAIKPVVEVGRVAELIAEHVEKNSIDLVVTGAHGSTSAVGLLIGSVADRLLRGSSAPILCIPDGAVDDDQGD